MSSAAETLDLAHRSFQMENTSEFSPEQLKAPLLLRCAAAFVDYMLLVALPVLWLLLSNVVGDGPAGVSLNTTVWLLVLIVWLVDFLALPLFRGQTLGKMFAGITIVKTDGSPVRLGTIVLRNVAGYLLTLLTLGIGFFISAVNSSGRSLHDYLAGTVVVHARRSISL
jgi:uncharacterized RDD family membrane protein YckC